MGNLNMHSILDIMKLMLTFLGELAVMELRYILNYVEVKGHGVCNLLPNT